MYAAQGWHLSCFVFWRTGPRKPKQEAQLPQRNSTSAAHVYLDWLTDRAMHRTPRNRRGCSLF